MANILMGVGMLGLPYVFKSAGWVGGFFVTIFFCFITWRISILMGRELHGDPRPSNYFDDSPYKSLLPPGSAPEARTMLPPIKSFPDIARTSFGEAGCFVLSSVLYFELFSCLCIFFVTLGDHLHALFPSILPERRMVFVSIVLTIPTALLRTPQTSPTCPWLERLRQ
jgi:vesicular inhibitory amino acid transporter